MRRDSRYMSITASVLLYANAYLAFSYYPGEEEPPLRPYARPR